MPSRYSLIVLNLLLLFITGEQINSNKIIPEAERDEMYIQSIYNRFSDSALNYEAFRLAYNGFSKIQSTRILSNDSLLTLIDYSKPSSVERLFILDIKNLRIIEKSLVAHGKYTGLVIPEFFSNTIRSHKSSLGFYITENTYFGKHGYSLRINGIEKGINDNAKKRAIVFHGAKYVSQEYIDSFGRIGRSYGCPALPVEKNNKIIDLIKEKSCVFIYHPTNLYYNSSELIIPD